MLISMRPAYAQGLTHKAAVLDVETLTWTIEEIHTSNPSSLSRFGVSFSAHQDEISLTPDQLARAMSGLELAYRSLCNEVFDEARLFMINTNYFDLDSYMRNLPDIRVTSKVIDEDEWQEGIENLPYLWNPDYEERLLWAGTRWISTPYFGTPSNALSTGHSFGWKIMYTDKMDTSSICNPKSLREFFSEMLSITAQEYSDAMRFMTSMFLISRV